MTTEKSGRIRFEAVLLALMVAYGCCPSVSPGAAAVIAYSRPGVHIYSALSPAESLEANIESQVADWLLGRLDGIKIAFSMSPRVHASSTHSSRPDS
jgi:hypothetical protein